MACPFSIATICVTPPLWRRADLLRTASRSPMKLLPDFPSVQSAGDAAEIVRYCHAREFDIINLVADGEWINTAVKDCGRMRALLSNRSLSLRLRLIIVSFPEKLTMDKINGMTTKGL